MGLLLLSESTAEQAKTIVTGPVFGTLVRDVTKVIRGKLVRR